MPEQKPTGKKAVFGPLLKPPSRLLLAFAVGFDRISEFNGRRYMNTMTRYNQWPGQAQDPLKQVFDRFIEGTLFPNTSTDESAVVTSQWVPRVDIKEETNRFVLYADIPGVDPQDIEVQMDKGMLTIKGERRGEATLESESFSRIERRHGSFHRRFALPDSADPEGISASGQNGVLQIVIPKRPETTPRRIQVGSVFNS
jgi:HSP20 family protein